MPLEEEDDIEKLIQKRLNRWKQERSTVGGRQEGADEHTVELTDANFDAELSKHDLMLVDFWAPWCGPCRWVSPILEQIVKENGGKLVLGKLNVDENPRTASRFGIQGIPTIMISKKGTIVDKIVGAAPKEALMERISPHLRPDSS